jgi:segregation and condensation protein B
MTNDIRENLKNNIEALLFFFNEPITFSKIAKILDTDDESVKQVLVELSNHYLNRGLRVVISDQEAQLVGYIDNQEILQQLDDSTGREHSLTPAVLETLAIIMYLGECTEATIDNIRGVRSSRTLRKLLRRGYVDKVNGNFIVSAEAMRQLNITSNAEIPDKDSLSLQLRSLAEKNND